MRKIFVNNKEQDYTIYIENDIVSFFAALKENNIKEGQKLYIISDDIVSNIYNNFIENIKKLYCVHVFILKNGEESKNYLTVNKIYDFLIEKAADRDSIIIGLGGGVVGDLAGFAASTYMRGIKYINIPTTLLSQVDSAVGGKVGYNYNNIKNAIGSFYNPIFVYVNVNFLKSLSEKQFINGLGEVVKYSLITPNLLLDYIDKNHKLILENENEKLMYLISECLKIKIQIIKLDYKDVGQRNILNFGHTVGHAIEVSSNYSISHGEAVALGMLTALRLSEEMLSLSDEYYSIIENLYIKLGLPVRYKVDNYEAFLYAIKRDKKNLDGIRFVLLKKLGTCNIKVKVNEKEIISALKKSIDR